MQFFKKIEALGTVVEIWLDSDLKRNTDDDLNFIEKKIIEFEKQFSRFLEESELNQLNKTDGEFKATIEMMSLLNKAQEFYQKTEGLFDPTVSLALKKLGYGKSFDLLEEKSTPGQKPDDMEISENFNFGQIKLDFSNNTILKPEEIKIDLGGIGKSYLVNSLTKQLLKWGYKNFWISAGGDMVLFGKNDGQFHQVGIQNPLKHTEDLLDLIVKEENLAVATSGITKRHWVKDGKMWHHIIDPQTKLSTENDLLAVTILGSDIIEADVLAKTVFILGKEKGLDFINKQETIEGLIIDKNLKVFLSSKMENYLIKNEKNK